MKLLLKLAKSQGPFIGPRGGKWADPQHTIPWKEPEAKTPPPLTDDQVIEKLVELGNALFETQMLDPKAKDQAGFNSNDMRVWPLVDKNNLAQLRRMLGKYKNQIIGRIGQELWDQLKLVVPTSVLMPAKDLVEITKGSEKQISWAKTLRANMIDDLRHALRPDYEEAQRLKDSGQTTIPADLLKRLQRGADLLTKVSKVNDSRFFIDQRDRSAALLIAEYEQGKLGIDDYLAPEDPADNTPLEGFDVKSLKTGSPKQIDWANSIRDNAFTKDFRKRAIEAAKARGVAEPEIVIDRLYRDLASETSAKQIIDFRTEIAAPSAFAEYAEDLEKMRTPGDATAGLQEPPPDPETAPKSIREYVDAIKNYQIRNTVVVAITTDGKIKFYSTFSPDFNEVFSNRSDVLTGITEYDPDDYGRITTSVDLAEEALEKLRERLPNYQFVVDPKYTELKDKIAAETARKQAPIPEVEAIIGEGFTPKPYQNEGIRFLMERDGNALIGDEMGLGKLNPISEPVLTPTGWKPIGQIQVGDYVIGKNGKPTEVLGVFPQGVKEIVKVTMTDGSHSRCGWDHLWAVKTQNDQTRNGAWRTLTTKEIYDEGLVAQNRNHKWIIPMVDPVDNPPKELLIEPYLMGVLLGDGGYSHNTVRITTDREITRALGVEGVDRPHKTCEYVSEFTITDPHVLKAMAAMGMRGQRGWEKSVPTPYMHASAEQRLALLQGLLDTDGTPIGKGGLEFASASEALVDAVVELAESLGGSARKKGPRIPKYTYKGEKKEGRRSWRVNVKLPPAMDPFRLQRKLDKWIRPTKYPPQRLIKAIEPDGVEDAVCIRVAAEDRLYVTRRHIVTHNTLQTLAYGMALDKKMIVVCPRVVRKNWIREGEKFFPSTFRGMELTAKHGKSPPDFTNVNCVTLNYENLEKLLPVLKDQGFDTLVVDESHRIKNPKAKATKLLTELGGAMKHRILLSGTALKNKRAELFTQLALVEPGLFQSAEQIKKTTIGKTWHKIQEVYLARTKAAVVKDLPTKTTQRTEIDVGTPPPMPQGVEEFSAAKAELAMIKVPATAEYVQTILEGSDSNVLVFTDSIPAAEALVEKLGDVAVIHTGKNTDKQRQAAVEAFDPKTRKEGEKKRVFVATTQSAGIGINLQSADTVVFNDLPWTPADLRQAEDRAHRIGQERPVTVHWMQAAGSELDADIQQKLEMKLKLMDAMLKGLKLTKEQQEWAARPLSFTDLLKRKTTPNAVEESAKLALEADVQIVAPAEPPAPPKPTKKAEIAPTRWKQLNPTGKAVDAEYMQRMRALVDEVSDRIEAVRPLGQEALAGSARDIAEASLMREMATHTLATNALDVLGKYEDPGLAAARIAEYGKALVFIESAKEWVSKKHPLMDIYENLRRYVSGDPTLLAEVAAYDRVTGTMLEQGLVDTKPIAPKEAPKAQTPPPAAPQAPEIRTHEHKIVADEIVKMAGDALIKKGKKLHVKHQGKVYDLKTAPLERLREIADALKKPPQEEIAATPPPKGQLSLFKGRKPATWIKGLYIRL